MITLIFSTEASLAKRGLERLVKEVCPNKDPMNFVSFNMAVSTPDEVAEEASAMGFFTGKKVVCAENCTFLDSSQKGKKKVSNDEYAQKLLDYCEHPNPSTDLFLTYIGKEPNSNNPIIAAIKKNGVIKEMKVPSEQEWVDNVLKYFAKQEIAIDQDAARELVNRIGNDYSLFLEERSKLTAFASDKHISLNDIKTLVSPKLESDTFAISNYLCQGNVKEALRVYKELKVHGADEVGLIGLLASSLRFLDQVAYLDDMGFDSGRIASVLSSNPGRVYNALKNLRFISKDAIEKNLETLYELDKAILFGNIDQEFGFVRYLVNFKTK